MIRNLTSDLALQALHGALESQKVNVKGVSIALCCHHQCSWNTYVGKAFFQVLFPPFLGTIRCYLQLPL